MADGDTRRREVPLRALLGDEVFEALAEGERTDVHYMGNDRLAPDFTLQDRHGRPWRLRDHRGKVIVLNFWTITCEPCLEEMPSLMDLARIARHHGGVEVVAVTTDRSWDVVAPVLPADPPATVLFDPDKSVVRGKFGTRLFPETWVIDPEGVIRLRVDGRRDWSHPVAIEVIESYR
jgi:peroxiredoxin